MSLMPYLRPLPVPSRFPNTWLTLRYEFTSDLKYASRSSPLALAQVEEIILRFKTGIVIDYEIIKFETAGTRIKQHP